MSSAWVRSAHRQHERVLQRYKICPYHMEANFCLLKGKVFDSVSSVGGFNCYQSLMVTRDRAERGSQDITVADERVRLREGGSPAGSSASRNNHEQGTPVPSQKTAMN
eukprot:jgi/Picre1/28904/NNA_004300.t1